MPAGHRVRDLLQHLERISGSATRPVVWAPSVCRAHVPARCATILEIVSRREAIVVAGGIPEGKLFAVWDIAAAWSKR
jgi:hypothetical protein